MYNTHDHGPMYVKNDTGPLMSDAELRYTLECLDKMLDKIVPRRERRHGSSRDSLDQ